MRWVRWGYSCLRVRCSVGAGELFVGAGALSVGYVGEPSVSYEYASRQLRMRCPLGERKVYLQAIIGKSGDLF